MIPFGRLIFFSCIAGSGEAGTKLLNILSGSFLRDRHVIGFDVFGYIAQSGFDNSPGGVLADLSPLKQRPNLVQADQTGDKHLTEHSWYSKWSLNGQIIRRPINDQGAPTTFSRTTYGVKAAEKAIRAIARGSITWRSTRTERDLRRCEESSMRSACPSPFSQNY